MYDKTRFGEDAGFVQNAISSMTSSAPSNPAAQTLADYIRKGGDVSGLAAYPYVTAFQASAGLTVDGKFGPLSKAALEKIVGPLTTVKAAPVAASSGGLFQKIASVFTPSPAAATAPPVAAQIAQAAPKVQSSEMAPVPTAAPAPLPQPVPHFSLASIPTPVKIGGTIALAGVIGLLLTRKS